jgi:nucleotide-binding universal stress UspA family protein
MIHKILVGYDGSESSQHALEFALELAGRFGSQLRVLAVSRPPDFGTEVETEAIIEQSRRHFTDMLESVKRRLAGGPVSVTFDVAVGHPAEQIIRYAEHHGIDHIVVGHRGHTLFDRWLIGSVARQVIAYARCTVTVIRR